jgi:hypothetical protein
MHGDGVLYAVFSPLGDQVLSAGEDFTAILSDVGSFQSRANRVKRLSHNDQIGKACFNSNGTWVLTVSRDWSARVWEARSGEPITPPLPHSAEVLNGIFADNRSVVTTDKKGISRIWQLPAVTHPLADLQRVVRLLTGNLADFERPSATSRPEPTAFEKWWTALKEQHHAEFSVRPDQVRAWHQRQQAKAQQEHDSLAVTFHARQLELLKPADRERRDPSS